VLQTKEEEDPSKKAFNAGAFAQFISVPNGGSAATALLALRIPGDDGDRSQHAVDPGDEL
jgi:hypothetical protein